MEAVFLGCFAFGALFTLASLLLGFAGMGGHHAEGPHLGHGDHGLHLGHGGHGANGANGHDLHAEGEQYGLPWLNFSALLSFVTWFGAAGYLLSRFAGASLLLALPVALLVGAAGALLIAWFLAKLIAGERVMRRADYALEGTLARVTVSIPAEGVGEIVFSKAGSRRGEAARAVDRVAISRETEVVVLAYERGVAVVQPWAAFLAEAGPRGGASGSVPTPERID